MHPKYRRSSWSTDATAGNLRGVDMLAGLMCKILIIINNLKTSSAGHRPLPRTTTATDSVLLISSGFLQRSPDR